MMIQAVVSLVALAFMAQADVLREMALEERPVPSDYQERVERRIVLIDVVVEDEAGNPVRGLRREDFTVRLDGRPWRVESVDDLCGCPGEAAPAAPAPGASVEGPAGEVGGARHGEPAPLTPSGTGPEHVVLFFDFGQLEKDGRLNAVEAARRWVRETMSPGQKAMVVGLQRRLHELSPMTDDREVLLAALDEAYEAPHLGDIFPTGFEERVTECLISLDDLVVSLFGETTIVCIGHARSEHEQGRLSLEGLRLFLSQLESLPGRKALVLFHQATTHFPARFYPGTGTLVGDHTRILDEVGAEATFARTSVWSAYAGGASRLEDPRSDMAVNLGANLADFTGGGYNRSLSGLDALIARASRSCPCVYRLGLRPPEAGRHEAHRVTLRVAGIEGTRNLRWSFLDGTERRQREAMAVLQAPGLASGLPLAASLRPVGRDGGGWELALEVALPVGALELLSEGSDRLGRWTLGAVLVRDEGRKAWPMEATSSIRLAEGDEPAGLEALHRRLIKVPPGRYRLTAFAADGVAGRLGGAEAEILLPPPGRSALIGPLLLRRQASRILLPLPPAGEDGSTDVRVRSPERGDVPANGDAVPADESLEARTWICAGKNAQATSSPRRFLTRGGLPVFRFPAASLREDGSCVRLDEPIEARVLGAGVYAYHLRWSEEDGGDELHAEVSFRISEGD